MANAGNIPTQPAPPRDRTSHDHEPNDPTPRDTSVRPSMQESFAQRNKEQAEAFKRSEEAAMKRIEGIADDDTRDRVLAMGGDATRSSPAIEQILTAGDAVPGLTTTTGAYRTPIDPTTAAVPAPEDSEIVQRMRGAPTVGSGKAGVQEELYKEPKTQAHLGPRKTPDQRHREENVSHR